MITPRRVRDRSMAIVSRRRFLELVGAAGGSTAVYRAASALGLMAAPAPGPVLELRGLGFLNRGAELMLLAILERFAARCPALRCPRRMAGRCSRRARSRARPRRARGARG